MVKWLLLYDKKFFFIDYVKEFELLLKDYKLFVEKLKLEKDFD